MSKNVCAYDPACIAADEVAESIEWWAGIFVNLSGWKDLEPKKIDKIKQIALQQAAIVRDILQPLKELDAQILKLADEDCQAADLDNLDFGDHGVIE